MINKKYIQIIDENINKEQAIILTCTPLIKDSIIDNNYCDQIIKALDTYGPYMAISKNIAILHASSKSIYKDNIGLLVSTKGIIFNHPINDPIHYLFILSSTSNENHIEALKKLSMKMLKDNFLQQLQKCNTIDKIYQYLNQ